MVRLIPLQRKTQELAHEPKFTLYYSMQGISKFQSKMLNFAEHLNKQHGSEATGHTFSTLKIRRTEYDASGTVMTSTHESVQKSLLQAS